MLKIKYLIPLVAMLLALVGCETNSYAEKRQKEQKRWNTYKEANNLILSTDSLQLFGGKGVSPITGNDTIYQPMPCPWPENLYFQTYRGAYVRLIKDDPNKRRARDADLVVLRFISYDLDGNEQVDNHDHTIYREGFAFVYTPGSEDPLVGPAFFDAVGCIHHDSQFEMIIDSKLGPSEQMEAVVTLRVVIDETSINNQ